MEDVRISYVYFFQISGQLLYFMAIWYISLILAYFPPFWFVVTRKIWQPWSKGKNMWPPKNKVHQSDRLLL
jgi:hypothetical protein